jgi:hypothetical protein
MMYGLSMVVFLVSLLLGGWSKRYIVLLLPGAALLASLLNYRAYWSDGRRASDEIDVLPGLAVAISAVALIVCFAAVALSRRAARASREG